MTTLLEFVRSKFAREAPAQTVAALTERIADLRGQLGDAENELAVAESTQAAENATALLSERPLPKPSRVVEEQRTRVHALRTAIASLEAAQAEAAARVEEDRKAALVAEVQGHRAKLAHSLAIAYCLVAIGGAAVRRLRGDRIVLASLPTSLREFIDAHPVDNASLNGIDALVASLGQDAQRFFADYVTGVPFAVDFAAVAEQAAALMPEFERRFAKEIGLDLSAVRVDAAKAQAAALAAEKRAIEERATLRRRWTAAVQEFAIKTARSEIPDEQALTLAGTASLELAGLGEPDHLALTNRIREYANRHHRGVHTPFIPDRMRLAHALGFDAPMPR